ncbi:MAG: histone deacetylase [Gammaproteobacteria bacterium]|jgi:acetoin utilization deacetylase AcuC-like enzyme|uniref:histone deacetylase family protein n=1 Tax=Sphaerotilus montanus TaxID=522889 RepID=UPI00322FC150|nr:histone deacetylase [Gammaproteobacteria bacterium]
MRAYYADHFVLPLPSGHRFPMQKYRLLRDAIVAELPAVRLEQAPLATEGELALVHTPGYVDAVLQGTLSAAQQREIGFPWSPAMAERARRSVGATVSAARDALREGIAANLAGGTHHASADTGSGYCVFNDLAVAARLMQAEWRGPQRRPLRVAVVDLDVHQGNGTAAIFREDPTVYTLSMHGARNFPFRKVAGNLDVDLPDGCTDGPYLAALDDALEQLWQDHADQPPELVFYQAGADPHEGDRLGRLKITAAGLAERDRRVFDACRSRGIPVVLTMGGGYGHVIEDTVAVQLQTYREALATWHRCNPGKPEVPAMLHRGNNATHHTDTPN